MFVYRYFNVSLFPEIDLTLFKTRDIKIFVTQDNHKSPSCADVFQKYERLKIGGLHPFGRRHG